MRDDRGIDRTPGGHDDRESDNALDTKRDVLAMYRATLTHDHDAMSAVINHTRCLGCLVAGVTQVGLWLAIHDDDDAGPLGYSHQFICGVMTLLDDLQYQLDGIAPPPANTEDNGG